MVAIAGSGSDKATAAPALMPQSRKAGRTVKIPGPGDMLKGTQIHTTEGDGATVEVMVSLMFEPTALVTLLVAGSNPREAVARPPELTFTPADWDVRQTFTVAGVDDAVADGTQRYDIIVWTRSEDGGYETAALVIAGVNFDDDEAGIVLGSASVSTDEEETEAEVMVSLKSEPMSPVTLLVAGSDPGEAAVEPSELTFTAADWNVSRMITVAGVDDAVADGPQGYAVVVRAVSGDDVYNGLVAEVVGINADDDAAGLVSGTARVWTDEQGMSAEVGISLKSEPMSSVTLLVAGSDPGEAVVEPSELTFTAADWNVSRMITVAGVDDDEADGKQSYAVVVRAVSGDGVYEGLAAEIAGVNADDDTAAIVPVTASVSTDEGCSAAAVVVSLKSDPGAAAVESSELTFTERAWSRGSDGSDFGRGRRCRGWFAKLRDH